MKRRKFVKAAMLLSGLFVDTRALFAAHERYASKFHPFKRVRPGDALWPSEQKWNQLKKLVKGNLVKLTSPLTACKESPSSAACETFFKDLRNPYFIGDNPALTQTSGWLDAWQAQPSAYAVAVTRTADVVAAVNFARKNNLRLVVKGGGHSYQGTSSSADSLLVWTRAMNRVVVHDAFVAKGLEGKQKPLPAVTVEAGAMWWHTYNEVTTKKGRYVQGGGCATVGVAGLIQSGGFGSFSKKFGMAAASLLEAEVVTADGVARTVNAARNPDLFWALKGGGGGSFGVVTRVTLQTRTLPETFGAVFGSIKAGTDKAYRQLIGKIIDLYAGKLFNEHWGEQVSFHGDNTAKFSMVFQGLSQQEAQDLWQPFEAWVKASPEQYTFEAPLMIIAVPAKHFWDAGFLEKYAPGVLAIDDRLGAPEGNRYWQSNKSEAGQFLWGYHSAWMPARLLEKDSRPTLANALFEASRHWTTSLHFNKGLAGAPPSAIAAAKDTATNPAMLEAFALAIIAGESEPAFPGIKGHEPDLEYGRRQASSIHKAKEALFSIVPGAGSYLAESNFFQENWQRSFWGTNYDKLKAVKKKYDPEGLFFVHHGVGSEAWSPDGFTRVG